MTMTTTVATAATATATSTATTTPRPSTNDDGDDAVAAGSNGRISEDAEGAEGADGADSGLRHLGGCVALVELRLDGNPAVTATPRTSPERCTSPALAPRGLETWRHRTSDTLPLAVLLALLFSNASTAASSGAAAFEQYEIGGWSFRHELPPSLRE